MTLTYFITGASNALGRELVKEVLRRGNKAIAAAREISSLLELEELGASCVEWDGTAPSYLLEAQAERIIDQYGPVDVLVNHQGYFYHGVIEESTSQALHALFDTNVWAVINTAKAFLPHMRSRSKGTVVNYSSVAGWYSMPIAGIYCASQFALRGFSETMYHELKPFGVRVLCLDLGYSRAEHLATDHDGSLKLERPYHIKDYDEVTERYGAFFGSAERNQPGDPTKIAKLSVDFVERTGRVAEKLKDGRELPWNLLVGSDAYGHVAPVLQADLANIQYWKDISDDCTGSDGAGM